MTDRPETPDTDAVQALWQGQERETDAMTLQAMRMLVRNDRDHVRQQLMLGFTLVLVEGVIFGAWAIKAKNEVIRAGMIVVVLGLTWLAWRVWRRQAHGLPSPGATTQTLIAFHRQQLERRRTNFSYLVVTAAPTFAGLFIAAYGMHLLKRGPPTWWYASFLGLCALWFVGGSLVQRRQARRLQQQIDDLDRMRRE